MPLVRGVGVVFQTERVRYFEADIHPFDVFHRTIFGGLGGATLEGGIEDTRTRPGGRYSRPSASAAYWRTRALPTCTTSSADMLPVPRCLARCVRGRESWRLLACVSACRPSARYCRLFSCVAAYALLMLLLLSFRYFLMNCQLFPERRGWLLRGEFSPFRFVDTKIRRRAGTKGALQGLGRLGENMRGFTGNCRSCRGLQGVAEDCRELQGIAESCRELPRVTESYREPQRITTTVTAATFREFSRRTL